MYKSIIISFLLLPCFLHAQTKFVVSGRLTDEAGETIPVALKIKQISDNSNFSFSNNKGRYYLNYTYTGNQDDGIEIKSAFYEDETVELTKRKVRRVVKDTLFLDIKLDYFNALGDDEVIVTAETTPEIIFKSDSISVSDFEFQNDRLLILTYQKTLNKGAEIVYTDINQVEIDRYSIPGEVIELFRDYQDNIYVVCKEQVFKISIRNEKIQMGREDKQQFYGVTHRILDTLGDHYFYSNFNDVYPAFDYYAQKYGDSTSKLVHHIEDEFIMELYRAEYKYVSGQDKLWALRKEMKTGIDKEIWIGARSFTNSLYYKSPYAPLFSKEDTTYIFDHYKNLLYKVDKDVIKQDSVPIKYHKSSKPHEWEQPLIMDVYNRDIYALFMKEGHYYVKRINTENGQASHPFKFYYKFVEKILIKDGYIYYIYRPYESYQKKYIYREKIKLYED